MNAYLEMFEFMGAQVVRLALAWIFAHSALHALRNLETHTGVIRQYRLLPEMLASTVAVAIPILMLLAAVGLLIASVAPVAALLGALLMATFTGAIATNLLRGRAQIDCGCGGAPGQRLSAGLVVRNVILGALLLFAAITPSRAEVDPAVVVGVLGGAVALVGFYFATNALLNNRSALRAAGDR